VSDDQSEDKSKSADYPGPRTQAGKQSASSSKVTINVGAKQQPPILESEDAAESNDELASIFDENDSCEEQKEPVVLGKRTFGQTSGGKEVDYNTKRH